MGCRVQGLEKEEVGAFDVGKGLSLWVHITLSHPSWDIILLKMSSMNLEIGIDLCQRPPQLLGCPGFQRKKAAFSPVSKTTPNSQASENNLAEVRTGLKIGGNGEKKRHPLLSLWKALLPSLWLAVFKMKCESLRNMLHWGMSRCSQLRWIVAFFSSSQEKICFISWRPGESKKWSKKKSS